MNCNCRFSFSRDSRPALAILTAGRCISICTPGTGFRAPETPASKWPCSRKRPISETANETKVPPIQGQFACLQERSAKSGLRGGGCSQDRTSLSGDISLLTGKRTGNLDVWARPGPTTRLKGSQNQPLESKFPAHRNREFSPLIRERFMPIRERFIGSREIRA
jgi:hypothetical protein